MPDDTPKSYVDHSLIPKMDALIEYLHGGGQLAGEVARKPLRYWRKGIEKKSYAALVDACVHIMLKDMRAGAVTADWLKATVESYEAIPKEDATTVRLDPITEQELAELIDLLRRAQVEMRAVARSDTNLKTPIALAIEYCYSLLMSR